MFFRFLFFNIMVSNKRNFFQKFENFSSKTVTFKFVENFTTAYFIKYFFKSTKRAQPGGFKLIVVLISSTKSISASMHDLFG